MPKDRLVATCYAAVMPTEQLWEKYVSEAEKLKQKGSIREEDYAVLVHSLEARNRLMDLTFGESDIIQGTVEDVLRSAKQIYIAEVSENLDKEAKRNQVQRRKIETTSTRVSDFVRKMVFYTSLFIWFGVLLFGLLKTSPEKVTLQHIFSTESLGFLVLLVITLLNLIFGYRVKDFCDKIAFHSEKKVRDYLIRAFSA